MKPKNTYDLLQQLRLRPAMYINPPTLPNLQNFLAGYHTALFMHDIPDDFLNNFTDFVADKLGFYESTAGFCHMILAYITGFDPKTIIWEEFLAYPISEQEHQAAMALYYTILDEFKHKKWKCTLLIVVIFRQKNLLP